MRLIDADKLKKHYAWWEGKMEVTKEDIDTIVDLQPTVEAVPTEFHDKCQQLEIQKRFKLEEDYRSMERTVEKLTKALAEAEPIVRCKDCKYLQKSGQCDATSLWIGTKEYGGCDDFFCGFGERKTE